MARPEIAIVDYGTGNIRSVERALAHVGASPVVTAEVDVLERAAGIVLPGVGAFGPALEKLSQRGLGRRLAELARRGKPILGVCLGYQLLFEESTERGRHEGLGLLSGRVAEIESAERVPVIGWCRTHRLAESELLAGVEDGAYFYFVHSFTPGASPDAVACAAHAPAAAARRKNVMGTQFHPEKSGRDGLRVYANFVELTQ